MARSIFSQPQFNDEAAAYAYVEARLWPDGPICPHCGVIGKAGKLSGKTDRIGSYKCYACRKKFSVKVGTIFESSHIAMRDWLTAIHLLCSSKKGISANQLSRTLGITLKSAWFVAHRIREAMRDGALAPLGGEGKTIEADETYIGNIRGAPKRHRNVQHKNMVLTLVERGGSARSFHIDGKAISDVMPIIRENVAHESRINTDEAKHYYDVGKEYAAHETVNHAREEYARKDGARLISTNTVEGYYSIFKRGMKGVYQHCGERHLHRYLAEFDFRYSNRARLGIDDQARAERALSGIVGKRLTYRVSLGAGGE
ncbi:MAG TPA: IS1595 family transposase [Methylovirgula sp.]|nr:IS1595 family transposase [Methylovirgula sp.]